MDVMGAAASDRSGRSALAGPLIRAALIGLVGALILVLVGGIVASTAGLVFVAGATGAGVGLALARAAVPPADAATEPPPLGRVACMRLAVALACTAVLIAAAGTWLVALREGGTLGPIEYLWTAFGPFVPAELIVASISAAWGARAGPVVG
jgi:hypothetical protein